MGKLTFADECIAPEKWHIVRYSGKDPWGVVKLMNATIRKFFHLGAADWAWDRVNYDVSGDPITFYCTWRIKKEYTRFSVGRIIIKVQGHKRKSDGSGEFVLRMQGHLNTDISGPSFIISPLWHLYSYLFYNRVRRNMIERCKEAIYAYSTMIKEEFDIPRHKSIEPFHAHVG